MLAYIVRRLLLIIPTLFGVMVLNFVIINVAPGGPIEQVIAQLQGTAVGATARFAGGGSETQGTPRRPGTHAASKYHGARGLDPELIRSLEKQFGFDKPAHERFFLMMWNFARFDFGNSFFRDRPLSTER